MAFIAGGGSWKDTPSYLAWKVSYCSNKAVSVTDSELVSFNISVMEHGGTESYLAVLMLFFKFVVIEIVNVNSDRVNYYYIKLKVAPNRLYLLHSDRVEAGMKASLH